MTIIDRGRVEALARKSKVLVDGWLRERQEALAERLAANVAVKKRWMESDPIEVSQRQCVHPANADVRTNSPTSLK